jgi:UDP-2-acetamido-2,6-beta-L-arabino-hexul-4-ose reductase
LPIAVGDSFDLTSATQQIDRADRLIHLAGVNRASDEEVLTGNRLFAQQAADALKQATKPPGIVVYANSTQVGNGSVYGEAKAHGGEILREAADKVGATFVDVSLPNIFGEHGRPFYNSVVSTFCQLLASGSEPTVEQDRELTLLHAQNAADVLIGSTALGSELTVRETVSGLLDRLRRISDEYAGGDIPDIASGFDRDLFNTYRSFTIESLTPISLERRADNRGSFFEIVRSRGGSGQSSFSTTVPGISRGDHYHRRKVERFTVLSGEAVISLRRLLTDQVISFEVAGDHPQSIDMPTMWAHNITNTGASELYTSFWSNEIFDPSTPDTFAEAV